MPRLQCPAGHFCVGGTSDKSLCAAGGFWCPPASYSQNMYTCAAGYYGTSDGAGTYAGVGCSNTLVGDAARSCGHYECLSVTPNGGSGGGCTLAGAPRACGAVYSGGPSSIALTGANCTMTVEFSTCAGPCTCALGYYCPPGSNSTSGVPCPIGHYCGGGSKNATLCTPGYAVPFIPRACMCVCV